jgi:DNA invertase Pin-like site-specific DNA recombinase
VSLAIYTRVSTADQNAELQSRDLTEHAAHQGWDIVEIYQDVMSGAKASHPALNRLMTDTAPGNSTACRFGSWTGSGAPWWTASTTSAPSKTCCPVHCRHPEPGYRYQNPASRFLQHVLGAAAEFERALIRERTQAGRVGNGSKAVRAGTSRLTAGQPAQILLPRMNTLTMRAKVAEVPIAPSLRLGRKASCSCEAPISSTRRRM